MSSENEGDMFRMLVSSDIHLGYAEKDPVKGDDSFKSFDELLRIGVEQEVDMVLLGGDLFHENKPSRRAEIKCLQILRNNVLGDRPVEIEYMSDPLVDFSHCNSKSVNYESSDINIALPVFSIHGNHDDPSGLGSTSCLDLIHEAGLVNYFGKITDLKHIKVRPLLLRKGAVKVALYGLSHVKDERLHRLFRDNQVEFMRPEEEPDSWCNILVLHQNRAKRSPTNYIPDSFIPPFFHLVIWGHEHDCRIQPEATDQPFFISQPGSPVATSLCEGEAIPKHVGVLNIRADNKFKMDPIPLKSVRPFIFKTISVTDLPRVDFSMLDTKKLADKIETELKFEVEEMMNQAELLLTGHPDQGTRPLLRLRVEYTEEAHQLSAARFGNNFLETVCNPTDILLFKKKPVERKVAADNFDAKAMGQLVEENNVTMEDLVDEYFRTQTEVKNQLTVLNVKEVGKAVKTFIDKDDKDALRYIIDQSLEATYLSLMDKEDALEILDRMGKVEGEMEEEEEEAVETRGNNGRDDLFSSGEEADLTPPPAKPGRGRGRGRARGRTREPSGGARGGRGAASTTTTTRTRRQTPETRNPATSTQSTLFQSFARGNSRSVAAPSQTQTRVPNSQRGNKKQVFDSDSD